MSVLSNRLWNLKQVAQAFSRSNSTLSNYCKHLDGELAAIQNAGTYKRERIIVTKQGSHIKVQGSDKDILNFCANNYLGLSVILMSFIVT